MGRWKEGIGPDGQKQAYWDANDSGPDQIAAPVQQSAMQPSMGLGPEVRRPYDPSMTGKTVGEMGGLQQGGTQYNKYGPGGSNDNITGPPGYYPVEAPSGGPYGNGTFSPGGAPGTPAAGDFSLMPGQGGMWDWAQGGQKGNGMLEAILQMMQQKFGGSGGLMGKATENLAQKIQTPQTPSAAPRPGASLLAGMKPLGGALGGLFGR